MATVVKALERGFVIALIGMMTLVILFATAELASVILLDLRSPPVFLLKTDQLLDIFGFFLLILIGVELLETIKSYLIKHVVRVEIVLEVALIAVARKVIILDVKDYPETTLLALAALITSLALAYHLERKGRLVARGASDHEGD
jgi:uncharacterized membrane protein (DUF373 family)